jgi:transcription initiation factor TFIIIB Brf1 subunit/transcription initiation factor TFIIB
MAEICEHLHRVDDYRSGDEVCLGCGLVLASILVHSEQATVAARGYGARDLCDGVGAADGGDGGDSGCGRRRNTPTMLAFILDTCSKLHLTDETAVQSDRYFRKLRQLAATRGFSNVDLAAFAIYCHAAQHCAGRTPQDVAVACGADPRRLCDLHELCAPNTGGQDDVFNDAKCFLGELVYNLHIPAPDEMLLREWVDRMPLEGCRPKTLAAAVTHLFCQKVGRAGGGVTAIARACGISPACLRRAAAKLKTMYM